MALIACPECGHQVSSAAPSCPGCGAPIAGAAELSAVGATITTVQETSKRLKLHTLISVVMICVGVVWAMAVAQDPNGSGTLAALLIVAGLVWYLVSRVRIWWHHK